MYDVIIIGGGPAGYRAALTLAKKQKSVLLIEKNKLGGTCLNEGCIPTKSILFSSSQHMSFNQIIEKRDGDINKLLKGLTFQVNHSGVECIYGTAIIQGKDGSNFIVSVDDKQYIGESLIIATGSRNKSPIIEGLDNSFKNGFAITSSEFLTRKESFPDNIAIIGGGVIGLEFATFLSNLGKTVKVFEYTNHILNNCADDDVESLILSSLQKSNIEVLLHSDIQEIDEGIVYKYNGQYLEYDCDLVVVATGRAANIENLGLEKIAVKAEKCIITNYNSQTNIPNVYACGDVNGKSMLAHVAYKEAEVAVDNICGINSSIDYDCIPSVVFANPEIAFVGLSEKECEKRNIKHYVKKCSMYYSSMYSIKNANQNGVCKMIFDSNDVLIGAQLIGNGSSELIFVLADMIERKETIDTIKNKVYPHPSIVEIVKETIDS